MEESKASEFALQTTVLIPIADIPPEDQTSSVAPPPYTPVGGSGFLSDYLEILAVDSKTFENVISIPGSNIEAQVAHVRAFFIYYLLLELRPPNASDLPDFALKTQHVMFSGIGCLLRRLKNFEKECPKKLTGPEKRTVGALVWCLIFAATDRLNIPRDTVVEALIRYGEVQICATRHFEGGKYCKGGARRRLFHPGKVKTLCAGGQQPDFLLRRIYPAVIDGCEPGIKKFLSEWVGDMKAGRPRKPLNEDHGYHYFLPQANLALKKSYDERPLPLYPCKPVRCMTGGEKGPEVVELGLEIAKNFPKRMFEFMRKLGTHIALDEVEITRKKG